jgi:glycosyltransferase involved in cell wall biosynthesis
MKVSIITPTYNSANTVRDTITSVNQQTYKNLEHIVIDGASTDNTLNILDFFQHKGPVLSEPDHGIYDAMNKGVKAATGEIIGILNSDDYYPDVTVIERVVKAFEDTNCDAVYGDLFYVNSNDTNQVVRKWVAGDYNRNSFYKGWMPPHPTFFVRKEVYEKYGLFNLNFKSSSDYEMLVRLLFKKSIKVKYLPGVLVHMRTGGYSNRSLKNRLRAHLEDYKAWKTNGISPKWYTVPMKPMLKIQQFVLSEFLKTRLNTFVPAFSQPKLHRTVKYTISTFFWYFLVQ